ncbi:hypothetical protein BDV38DRAFT_161962 [Aspergillus pseudotamarii]|uniref:Utp8 beta-propeller domain-containing protein n=1 Tax=Aspergillus pseudotamarii TaxID=132259 RepID=A0A5N6SMK2_ASPPS|nr:uncharacterized protein BDV38DRAFT_161962 [Aspergillus pseudotamarii]KAE8134364.1 hypothetical protein BDV38DRAFT_161962 [Aspergillus pseudotamarii]
MDLQQPSVLAQLPRPLHASKGKTHIGEVYSLSDSKKRKRYEVAVAVDGEAVNIYNIQTPKLVTSYAVPPQSTFSCEPCSVRRKLSDKSVVKRQTYVAVNPQKEIKCFVEESGGNGSSAPVISSSSFSVKDSSSPTVFIGIFPTGSSEEEEKNPFDIVTVQQDGRVRRLAADLDNQHWSLQHSELAKISSSHAVQACFLVEFEDAKKSLFKRRQDLAALALGDLVDSNVDEPSVLLLVSHPTGSKEIKLSDVKVHMFSVPTKIPSQERSLDESQKMKHLLTFSIPDIKGQELFESSGLEWDFHTGSAGLNLSFAKGFVNFDLSQYKPTVTSQFILENEDFSSLMRISPQSVIGAGNSIVALFDTQYKSIQRSIAIDDIHGSNSSKARTKFISYYAKLGIAVATKGNTLFAFDLSSSNSLSGSSLKRSRDSLLIDAIGRGIGSSISQWDVTPKKLRTDQLTSLGLTSKEQVSRWNDLVTDLRVASESKNGGAFDSAVQAYFEASNVDALPKQYVNPEVMLFLLSCIFSMKDAVNKDQLSVSSSSQLSIDVWPEHTCQWLTQLGHLSLDNVEIALRRSLKPRILPALPTGSFVQALIDADPTLKRLIDILQGPVTFSSDELAYTLKFFLNMARSRSAALEETPQAITSGEENSIEAIQNPEATLQDIFRGLNTTLRKIHIHPLPTITTSIRSTLSRTEIIAMVHHLRLSLATGGYASRFTENPPTPICPDQTTPSLTLNTITDLLNVSVDAVGPSGWISATAFDDTPTREMDLIADMKSEISAALAGVEEASYLKGVLGEYLRYTDSVAKSAKSAATKKPKDSDEPMSSLVRFEKLNGADVMVFRSAEEEGFEGDASGKMLPLSLKAASTDVGRTKVKRSTGEVQKRSNREIGYLRRKAVGKYSFERLIV